MDTPDNSRFPGSNYRPRKGSHRRGKKPFKLWQRPELTPQTTTLWEYPSQHYGLGEQGSKHYVGATPSWVIWNCLQRYTNEGDLVLDPMCGSGTTLDVCRDLGRQGKGYDVAPFRPDIEQADARKLPLMDGGVDFVFVDPPYSTHVEYSDDERCIGKLDAASGEYYAAMETAVGEMARVLKPGGHLALYVSDSFKKGKPFMPIGFELFSILKKFLEPVDVICVVRHNAKLKRSNWHAAAEEGNFFLRGFNYLFLFKKAGEAKVIAPPRPKGKKFEKKAPKPVKIIDVSNLPDDIAAMPPVETLDPEVAEAQTHATVAEPTRELPTEAAVDADEPGVAPEELVEEDELEEDDDEEDATEMAAAPEQKAPRFDKPFGKKPFGGKKPFVKKPFGNRSFDGGDRPYGKKPFGRKQFGDRPYGGGGRRFGGGRFGEEQGGGRPYFKKPFGDRPFGGGGRKFGERPYGGGDRPYGKGPFDGERPAFKKPFERKQFGGGQPYAKRPFGYKPPPPRQFGEESMGEGSFDGGQRGDRPYFKKPFGNKPFGGSRKFGDRPYGKRPFGDKPFDRKFGDRPFGKRPFGKKPFHSAGPAGERPRKSFAPKPKPTAPKDDTPAE